MEAAESYIVKPVYKALSVLKALGEAGQLSLVDATTRLKLPKTTTYRYLQTLQHCGFASYDVDSETYRLGPRIWELAELAKTELGLGPLALPEMRRLRNRFNETVNLAVLEATDVIYVEILESSRNLRMQARVGGRDPAYATALGKAMLAFLPQDRWRDHVPARLAPRTSHTRTTLTSLREDLAETRARGYAIDRGENDEETLCLAVPVLSPVGAVLGAVSVASPAARINDTLEEEIARELRTTGELLSRRFGVDRAPAPAVASNETVA